MNTSLWILAIVTFLLAALVPAWPLMRDPNAPRRRRLQQALLDGLIKQAEYDKRLRELEQERNSKRPRLAIILFLAIPLLGLWVYEQIGTPEAVLLQASAPSQAEEGPGMSIDEAIASLEQRLFADPDNPANVEGWALLANSYESMGRYDDALKAYQKANEIDPEDPEIQLELAEALLFASPDGRLPPKGAELLQNLLTKYPGSQKALWLAGVAAYQEQNFAQALSIWKQLRATVTNPAAQESLDEQIAKAEHGLAALSGGEGVSAGDAGEATMAATTTPAATDNGRQIRVVVDMSAEMQAQRSDEGLLFVFARTPQGGPPLASLRLQAAEFPIEVDLSDANAMLAGRNLSSTDTVIIGARWSKSGQALPQSGDLEGYSGLIQLPTSDTIAVTIDNVR